MIPHAVMFRDLRNVHRSLADAEIDVDETLDLTAAALEEDDPQMEQARLATRGFRYGHTIRWIVASSVVSLTVHELASPADAILSVADHRETLRAATAILEMVSPSIVSGYMIDGIEVIRVHSSATGAFHVTVVARVPVGTVDQETIELIALQQRALLAELTY